MVDFFVPRVGALPMKHTWLHAATKFWIMVIIASNRRAMAEKRVPKLPIEMWGFIVAHILGKTFTNYGLDPIKAIRGWIPVCPALKKVQLAGSTVLRVRGWKGWDSDDWDLYGNHETVFAATVQMGRAIGSQDIIDRCDPPVGRVPWGARSKISSGPATGSYVYGLRDKSMRSISRIKCEGLNINIISHRANYYSFERFDILAAGYHYVFLRDTWCAPDGTPISKLPVFDQWTLRSVPRPLVQEALFEISWEDGATQDVRPLMDKAEYRQMFGDVLKDRDTYFNKHTTQYDNTRTKRIEKYRERAAACGMPFSVEEVTDIKTAIELVRYVSGYLPTNRPAELM